MQSGISASQELLSTFRSFVSDLRVRGFLVGIDKEALVPGKSIPASGTFEQDVAQLETLLVENQPAYIILRRYDSDTMPLVCVTYVPDTANVRQKMLFASTRNTLTRELGAQKFADSIFATTKAELTAEGFRKHDDHAAEPAPLTEEESTMKAVREAEAEATQGMSARKAHTEGGVVPFSKESIEALSNLQSGGFINLVQLAINIEKEVVELANASSSAIGDFTKVIADDSPRYSFFVFKHTHGGVEESPIVFIYTCPPQSTIKERMMYATCRKGVVFTAEHECGLKIEKRLEATSPDEIGEEQLLEKFHPQKEVKAAFQKPRRPGR